jgi:hypothetical protein
VAFVGHSCVVQHALLGMHLLPHVLKVGSHLIPQIDPSQVAWPSAGTGHGVHEVPHELTLSFAAQAPLQSCVMGGHCIVQLSCDAMHVPAQGFLPDGQLTPHLVPSHVALPPLMGMQAEHDVPQVWGSALLTHAFEHSWVSAGQVQTPAWQDAPVGHSVASQHFVAGMHSVPQRRSPSEHPASGSCARPASASDPTSLVTAASLSIVASDASVAASGG